TSRDRAHLRSGGSRGDAGRPRVAQGVPEPDPQCAGSAGGTGAPLHHHPVRGRSKIDHDRHRRRRPRDERGDPDAPVRSLLHDQARGHGARHGDRAFGGRPPRGRAHRAERARQRHAGAHPASPRYPLGRSGSVKQGRTILVVDDEPTIVDGLRMTLEADANVLIVGESGTGKELIANALHERSHRREGPWIKINCAALPKDLIESELFGHTKGAFTGATTDKVGLLEEAHHGSLLLDEIIEMPQDLQAKLLRVLEERVVRRLGGTKAVPVDFRLISSTNRSPEIAIRDGSLRQDLYFRINTVTIAVPALRERREDIPILVRAFLERYTAKHARPIDAIAPEAYRRLLAHSWPGNVRELQHAIERAVLVSRGREIMPADLPEALQHLPADGGAAPTIAPSE